MSYNKIVPISFADVEPFIKEAKKEQVSFVNNPFCKWYGMAHDGCLVAFFCLMVKGKVARFKSNYTLPNFRKRGYLGNFILYAKNICANMGIKKMTCFCTKMSVKQHLRAGAVVVSKKRHDITFVKYVF